MDAQIVKTALKFYIAKLRERLEHAAGIAEATGFCAKACDAGKAVAITLDVEQQILRPIRF